MESKQAENPINIRINNAIEETTMPRLSYSMHDGTRIDVDAAVGATGWIFSPGLLARQNPPSRQAARRNPNHGTKITA